jgi:hypothetical protein
MWLGLKIGIYIFGAVVVLFTVCFLMMEALERVEGIKKRVPWFEPWLAKRKTLTQLLLIAIVLLAGNGYELFEKEIPEVPSPPTIKIPAPLAPVLQPAEGNTQQSLQPKIEIHGLEGLERALRPDALKTKLQEVTDENVAFADKRDETAAELHRKGTLNLDAFDNETARMYRERFAPRLVYLAEQLEKRKRDHDARDVRSILMNTADDKAIMDSGYLRETVIPHLQNILGTLPPL